MKLNLEVDVPDETLIDDIGMVFTLAAADVINYLKKNGNLEIDENVILSDNVEFFRIE